MGTMHVSVYGKDYPIACDDGQEARLGKLVQQVNERISKLAREMGRGPETTLLVFTTLMLADELEDTRNEINNLKNELHAQTQGNGTSLTQSRLQEMEAAMASSMEHIAERIEMIAHQLDAA